MANSTLGLDSAKIELSEKVVVRSIPLSPNKQAGFTLVELSIVLIVISLLIGGILVGRNLLQAARLNRIVSEKEQLALALNTFRVRYSYLPGDLPNATSYWGSGTCNGSTLTTMATCNGNGNDQLSGPEAVFAIHHLMNAGLIRAVTNPGNSSTYITNGVPAVVPGFNIPKLPIENAGILLIYPSVGTVLDAYNGTNFFLSMQGHHYLIVEKSVPSPVEYSWWNYGNNTSGTLLSCPDAYRIDSKVDDGFPGTGSVKGKNISSCIIGSGPQYQYRTNNESFTNSVYFQFD
jgi:prepilin-type N-terminal cleavage/methylation domain-containing protein